jgi:2-amino-4-hydroxy-6-hydroxymethyldihydropteridine diphosphokinase
MNKNVYLSLGSNVGDREANLRGAIERLGEVGTVKRTSQLYETEPMEVTRQPWFINCAVELETKLMPRQLLSAVLKIERAMGRRRSAANAKGPRTIDIDIVLFGKAVMQTATLTLPHLALHQRRFVLAPLAEIAADVNHPVIKRSIRDLRDALPPTSGAVRVYALSPK